MKRFGFSALMVVLMVQLSAQQASINLSDIKQTITGFGGAHSPEWGVELTNDQIDKIFGNAPGQLGLNILRVPVPTDSTMFPIELPGALRAKQNGALVFASPWSPPAFMKTNNSTVQGKLDPAFYDEFAYYLDSFANYMASNGAPLYAISLQNEPDWLPTYTSCGWDPADFVNFLSKSGAKISSTKVIAAESLNFSHDYTDPILNSPEAEPNVDILGGHLYGSGGIQDYPLARTKGKEVWMTEHYLNGTTYDVDLATAKEIHDCMVVNYNAYVYWYAINEVGFLSVGGDILKRGYVMSQYSKFIRPGSTRVGVTTTSAPNIDVSAYIKDTNLVVVAINRNSSPVEIDFDIQNGSDYSFTKFVTSATKNVANDSTVATSNGTCTVLLDALSVTTFTTLPNQGGRRGNIAPVANAGSDTIITDEDNNGFELVTLNGAASSDADGSVIMYTWSEAGKQIAAGMNPAIEIKTGVHKMQLTITDSDGSLATDSVTITVNLPAGQAEVHLWFEAECAIVGENWDILPSNDASNGIYLEITPGKNTTANASEDTLDQVILPFQVADSGDYTIWVRSRVPSADDDSYWVKMDNGEWYMWNNISGGSTYQWDDAPGESGNIYRLSAGEHLFTMSYREDGAEMDKIYITNTGTVPIDLGGNAEVCTGILSPTANAGPNQILTLAENSVTIDVTLNGSLSNDADGEIVDYTWTITDTLLTTGANPMVKLPEGTHRILLTVTDDYGNTAADEVVIKVNTAVTSIYQQHDDDFVYRIYPNPFVDNIRIEYSLNQTKKVKIELVDISGRSVSTFVNSYVNQGNHTLEIDGNKIQQGIYYVVVHVGDECIKYSLVVKK